MTDKHRPFRLARTADGGWYWRVVALNGETLAHSETYTSKRAAQEGIAAAIGVIARVWPADGNWLAQVKLVTAEET